MKRLSQILLILLAISIANCSKTEPDTNPELLQGIWVDVASTETATVNSYLSYHFKSDNKVEVLRVFKHETLNEIVGYSYWGLGSYNLSGNTLTMTMNQIYLENPDIDGYSDLEDMVLTDGITEDLAIIGFTENNQILTFDHPCESTDNCVGRQTFRKSQVPF